jgi:nucleotide-binding universal stress UspA family protein
MAAQHGLDVSVRQEPNNSNIWQTILDVVRQVDAELIVVGTHGATAVEHALLGSVSNALVHHSERPVLVVPAGSADKQ